MKNNQHGGILSNLILIPAAVVILAGVFFSGYYLGRKQAKSDVPGAGLPPLPDVVSQNLPKPDEFTFYKTLTAKEDKTVSIDLRPKAASPAPEKAAERKQADVPPRESVLRKQNEKGKTAAPEQAGTGAVRKTAEPQKKDSPAVQTASSKQRYSIQIASHQERQTADLDVKKMKHQGFAAYIVASDLPGKGTWYRVRVGSFTNKAAAEKLQKEVRAKAGVSSIVVTE